MPDLNHNVAVEAQALRLDQQHRVQEAVDLLLPLGRVGGLSGQAHYRLVRLLLEQSEVATAQEISDNALTRGADAWVLSAQSHIYQTAYRQDEALSYAERAWHLSPAIAEAGYALHSAHLLAGHELTARHLLTQLASEFPQHAEIQIEFACRAELSPNEQHEALLALQKTFPHARTLRLVLSTVHSALHDLDTAMDEIRWLLQRVPSSHEFLGLGALITLQQGRRQEAEALANQAINRSRYAFLAHLTLFHCALECKELAQARRVLDEVSVWVGSTINEMSFLPQMWSDLGEVEQATALLHRLNEVQPDTPEVALGLARAATGKKAHAEALKWACKAREMWPNHYESVIAEARGRYDVDDSEGALALLETLPESEAVDVLRLKARRSQAEDFMTLVAAYEDHLRTYPSFDYVWGILLRYYLEAESDAEVERLLTYPRPVPPYVRSAVNAYRSVVKQDDSAAERHLQMFLDTREKNRNWQWCWELIIETLESPKLAHWLVPLSNAAKEDGV